MEGNNLLQYINELESNLDYSLEPTYAPLTSVMHNENNLMQVDQFYANYSNIETNLNNNNIQPPSSSSSSSQQ